MVTAQQLIDDGIVTENPDDTNEVIFNIPIRVKKTAIDAGGLETFAGVYGWTPEIDGQPNPEIVTAKCKSIILAFVRNVFTTGITQQVNAQANVQKEALLEQLL